MSSRFYSLPELSYEYNALEPYISEQQLAIHHQKHHAAYVKGANAILEKLDKSRKENRDLDMKSILKSLSYHIGGHVLHSLFWKNMASSSERGEGEPEGKVAEAIKEEFGSFERFKEEFAQTALSVEGSGWAVLTFCRKTKRAVIMQIEKHNLNIYPGFSILMVLDFWEHAYYIDHKNEKAKFVEAFWNVVDWKEVENRLNLSY